MLLKVDQHPNERVFHFLRGWAGEAVLAGSGLFPIPWSHGWAQADCPMPGMQSRAGLPRGVAVATRKF